MTNKETRDLALRLLAADEESEVIEILTQANLWQRPECWRLYGDDENNFRTVGAQQARPASAVVEEIVNSVDARLMDACGRRGYILRATDDPVEVVSAKWECLVEEYEQSTRSRDE